MKQVIRNATVSRFVPDVIKPEQMPKTIKLGQLTVGQSVWYLGERFYVESVPAKWEQSCFIRIGSYRFNPENRTDPLPNDRLSLCVYADLVTLAKVNTRSLYGRQPTQAAIKQREIQKATGIKDNGDDVAVMLRACDGIDDVYKAAAKYLKEKEKDLRAKYAHLDNGRQRMTLGNRMRGEFKRRQK